MSHHQTVQRQQRYCVQNRTQNAHSQRNDCKTDCTPTFSVNEEQEHEEKMSNHIQRNMYAILVVVFVQRYIRLQIGGYFVSFSSNIDKRFYGINFNLKFAVKIIYSTFTEKPSSCAPKTEWQFGFCCCIQLEDMPLEWGSFHSSYNKQVWDWFYAILLSYLARNFAFRTTLKNSYVDNDDDNVEYQGERCTFENNVFPHHLRTKRSIQFRNANISPFSHLHSIWLD